jgi:hypothetical protein
VLAVAWLLTGFAHPALFAVRAITLVTLGSTVWTAAAPPPDRLALHHADLRQGSATSGRNRKEEIQADNLDASARAAFNVKSWFPVPTEGQAARRDHHSCSSALDLLE